MSKPMNNLMKRKQQEILNYHCTNGFIDIGKLSAGTYILIETSDEIYEFEVGTPKFNVVLVASDGRFEHRDKMVVVGSLDLETNILLPRIIGEGLKIVLRPCSGKIIRTGPVLSAKITGKTYKYEMWANE